MEIIISADTLLRESLKYIDEKNCFLRRYYILKEPINLKGLATLYNVACLFPKSIQHRMIKKYIDSKTIIETVDIPYCESIIKNDIAIGTPIRMPVLALDTLDTPYIVAFTNAKHLENSSSNNYKDTFSTNFIALDFEDKKLSPEELKNYIEQLKNPEFYQKHITFLINHLKNYKDENGIPISLTNLCFSKNIKIKEQNMENITEETKYKKISSRESSPTLDLILEIRTLLSTYPKETRAPYEQKLQEILQATNSKNSTPTDNFQLNSSLCNLFADIKYMESPKLITKAEYIDKYLTDILTEVTNLSYFSDIEENYLEEFYRLVNIIQNKEEISNITEYDALHQKATTILTTILVRFPYRAPEKILDSLSQDFEQSIRLHMLADLENELSAGENPAEIYPLLAAQEKDNKTFIQEACKVLHKTKERK